MHRILIIGAIIILFLAYTIAGSTWISNKAPDNKSGSTYIGQGPTSCDQLSAKDQKLCTKECKEFAEGMKKRFDALDRGIIERDSSQKPGMPTRQDFKDADKCNDSKNKE